MADQGSAGAIPEEIIEQSRVFAKIDLHGLRKEEAMKVMMKQSHFLVMTFLLVILLSGCSVSERTAAQDRTESEGYT